MIAKSQLYRRIKLFLFVFIRTCHKSFLKMLEQRGCGAQIRRSGIPGWEGVGRVFLLMM